MPRGTGRHKWGVTGADNGMTDENIRGKIVARGGQFAVIYAALPENDQRNIVDALRCFSRVPNMNILSACALLEALALFMAQKDRGLTE